MIVNNIVNINHLRTLHIWKASSKQILETLKSDKEFSNQLILDFCVIEKELIDFLASQCPIRSIILNANSFMEKALTGFEFNSHIDELQISHSYIGDDGAKILATMSVRSLHLVNCQVGDSGALDLAKNLTICHLNLRQNKVSYEAALVLKANQNIKTLNLIDNYLDYNEILKLKDSCTQNVYSIPSLKSLCLFSINKAPRSPQLKRKIAQLNNSFKEDLELNQNKIICL